MTSATDLDSHIAADVRDTPVEHYWEEYQYVYTLYTLGSRAIPSALDGLKPVQRRLLYQMHLSRLVPGSKPSKSSKVCSAVSGNLHPHGDTSVYGAAGLLAAHFQRVRLIDGQGSFPRVQGDIPASARYTEMRLSAEGNELVRELTEHSVPMIPSFDGELLEPTVLPSRFPVLLVNGAVGIAEAYSTRIPAHNPREVIALCRAMLANPSMSTDDICEILTGPDWGSGGVVVGRDGIRDYIETGRGKMTVRGEVEAEGRDLVVTSLPPGVASQQFQESVREKISEGKLPGVSDLSNLTDRKNGLRIVVSVKRGHTAADVLESLYANTALESSFAASLVALDADRVPRWWTVAELVSSFLELRDSVVLRRSQHRMEKATERRHLVAGLLVVQLDIDRAVALIRAAANADAAKDALMAAFDIDAVQAQHVLSMQLRKLTSQDTVELQKEAEELDREMAVLSRLISSPAARRKVIDKDLVEVERLFSGAAYDRCTRLDLDAVPSARGGQGDDETPGVSKEWRLSEAGVFGSVGADISQGTAWAAFTDGRIKVTDGKGLPRPGRDVLVAPDISALLRTGVAAEGEHLFLVTRRGKILRLDPSAVNPQGVAGNGIAGIKLSDEGDDAVIAAFSGTDSHELLSISEKAYKVTSMGDVPCKGRGGQGVGFHLFVKGEDALSLAQGSAHGFRIGGKRVTAAPRAKSTTKGEAAWESITASG